MKKFDVFVIGSGMAGMSIANICAGKGLKVGITDELPYGGTCALRGCDPKKLMLAATEARDFAQRLHEKQISEVPAIHWKAAMKFKQEFVDAMPPKIEKGYKNNGVETFHQSAKFISENQLQVGDETIEAGKRSYSGFQHHKRQFQKTGLLSYFYCCIYLAYNGFGGSFRRKSHQKRF